MSRQRVIFAGSGEFGLPTLKALCSQHEVVQVYTQPDRPAGRGRKLTPTPIGQYAVDQALPLIRTGDINQEPLPAADVLVVIAFGQKIAESVVHHSRLGSVNLHASILPRHRGAAPIHAAMLAGDRVTGNSIIRLAPKMDAGAVLAQSAIDIAELETTGELHDRLALDGATLMLQTLDALEKGTATAQEQDHSLATLAPKLSREATRLDWSQTATKLSRQILALYPWPGCRVSLREAGGKQMDRLTLVRARPSTDQGEPGKIGADGSVGAGSGSVVVVEVQPEGKRPMSLDAYRNGHPWISGATLESIL
jgi:methionyl-tRNA formyltransferase